MRLLKMKRFWLILLLPFSYLLLELASLNPELVERFYSRGIYRYLMTGVFGRITALVPFSLTGFIIAALICTCIAAIVRAVRRRRHAPLYIHKKRYPPDFQRWIANLCCAAGVVYFLFAITCGLNYHRLTFAEQSGLAVRPSSDEELAALCAVLVEQANTLRADLPEDENGVMEISVSPYILAKEAQSAYVRASADYPMLAGFAARPKPVPVSLGMSWIQISGIYIPFLFEPNVNVDMTAYNIPATMMHEMSHFKGFMRENEANFLAYLTCKYSEEPVFQYSGIMMALSHSSDVLYEANRDLYYAVMEPLSEDVWADRAANNEYWQRFKGPVGDVSTAINNTYLRSNKQESGVKSYGEMVDLLLAEYRDSVEAASQGTAN